MTSELFQSKTEDLKSVVSQQSQFLAALHDEVNLSEWVIATSDSIREGGGVPMYLQWFSTLLKTIVDREGTQEH